LIRFKSAIVTLSCLGILLFFVKPAHAQHGDWLLGTDGLLSAQQPPEGILYQNLWSWYHASGDSFLQSGNLKCGPLRGRLCLSANLSASGSLDIFVDQNIFWLVTPFKFLGANYGFLLDVPFAITDASGAAALEPVLNTPRTSFAVGTFGNSSGSTKGSIGDIYFEPINLGWHFRQLDAIVSGGFMAPTGPYNQNARLNIGFGHWSGDLGLGGIAYADPERTWALSIYAHYEIYASQMGRNYTLGNDLPFEWSASKTLNLHSDIFQQLTVGAVGYAQWQTSDNHIDLNPSTSLGQSALSTLEHTHMHIYAAGPGIQLLTKFGLFELRYYDEFGAKATPSGQQLMFSVTLAGRPWGR
jgi:hypothetical protein